MGLFTQNSSPDQPVYGTVKGDEAVLTAQVQDGLRMNVGPRKEMTTGKWFNILNGHSEQQPIEAFTV